MTGRGIDQVLPHPGDPVLHESYLRDARGYVELAEDVHGPIRKPLGFREVWGDALAELARSRVDARIVNLETSITSRGEPWLTKGIHYRMHPANIGCITAAQIDCCCLANNHVLDWGYDGLNDTLDSLDRLDVTRAGAGRNSQEAEAVARIAVANKRDLLVLSAGTECSGIPSQWAAGKTRAGVYLLKDISETTAEEVASKLVAGKRKGDLLVASIHWGGNWGYEVSREQIQFARRLIDAGVDIVHGHSSHHFRPIEVYRRGLILYGCGDFLNDYEGIGGFDEYRSELRLMYVVAFDPVDGGLQRVRIVPFESKGFRLIYATNSDVEWVSETLGKISGAFGTTFNMDEVRGIEVVVR